MSSIETVVNLSLSPTDNNKIANLCGPSNENISFIEQHFGVIINHRSNSFSIKGQPAPKLSEVKQVLQKLYQQAENAIKPDIIQSFLSQSSKQIAAPIHLRNKTIQLRNQSQMHYMQTIESTDIVFSVGPAGTGKTYLAVAKACELLEKGNVQRLIFVRPAVEAGEKLGFLPGDLVDKVLPFLRPIYDALYEMLGFNEAQKLIKTDIIEILPLAFMRGRTLNEAFIILDEAQNTTIQQMKMFLTRIGFGSKAIITGDITQTDLPRDTCSGLAHAIQLFRHDKAFGINHFSLQDIVRHPLVSKIIQAYEDDKGHDREY